VVADANRPDIKAKIFKVPHHGSETGHNDDVWTKLLAREPITATTPLNKGHLLPRASDVTRIVSLSGSAYVSRKTPLRQPRRRQNVVMKMTPRSLVRVQKVPGHIMIRKQASAPQNAWSVSLFDGADLLRNFEAA
jgi:hypothetical protein